MSRSSLNGCNIGLATMNHSHDFVVSLILRKSYLARLCDSLSCWGRIQVPSSAQTHTIRIPPLSSSPNSKVANIYPKPSTYSNFAL